MHHEKNPSYIHHQEGGYLDVIREIIFGVEDGMVSTLGTVTGIAVGVDSRSIVLLAGFVIVAVESLSMAVGSYLSSKSETEIDARKMWEEQQEIAAHPQAERKELVAMYVKEGWPSEMAERMSETAAKNPDLMLKEMAYRELGVIHHEDANPVKNGLAMFVSYIIGGAVPLSPYLFLPVPEALRMSIPVTFAGLFALGVATTRFTKRTWWKAGLEVLLLGGAAVLVGYLVGSFADGLIVGAV